MLAPWMLGSEPVPAQWVLFGGALATLLAGGISRALGPRRRHEKWYRWALAGSRFCGALLLVEIGLQAVNPSNAVIPDGTLWRLIPLAPDPWLPSGIAGRFDEGGDYIPFKNPARYALIFGAVWCYAAGLTLGLMGRTDARRWAVWLGANGVLMAVVCLFHRAMQEELTLWRFRTTFDFTHSPIFFYKNHNGAYLAGVLAVVLGLAASQRTIVARRVWEAGALALWLATVAVGSRAALAIASLWVMAYVTVQIRGAWQERRTPAWCRWGGLGVSLGLLFSTMVVVMVVTHAAGVRSRFGDGGAAAAQSPRSAAMNAMTLALRAVGEDLKLHAMQREVALAMWRDRPLWGWGGGAYVYLFNTYHERVPALAARIYRDQPQLHRFYGPTANCDWVEFLAEYGALGVACMVGALVLPLSAWIRRRGWRDPLSFFLILAVTGLLLHAWLDYILRNPALLMLGSGALVAAIRMASPDRRADEWRETGKTFG